MSSRRTSVHEAYLQNIPLAAIVDMDGKDMISIDIHATLEQTLNKLCDVKNNLQAIPVFNKSTNKYEYIASRLDIIAMLAHKKESDEEWMKAPLLDVLESEVHAVDPRIFQRTLNDVVIDVKYCSLISVHTTKCKNIQITHSAWIISVKACIIF